MKHSDNPKLEKVYAARTDIECRAAYNEWAQDYEADVSGFGIQLPYVGVATFARHVALDMRPILDAGCGTAMHSLPLAMMGYGGFHGIDISEKMLEIAAQKHIYDSLQHMTLGARLDFKDDQFAVTYAIGVLAPGNAPPHSLDEFIRVTRKNGLIIFSTHVHDNERTRPFHTYRHQLVTEGVWHLEFETPPFVSMPGGDKLIEHAVYVYRVLR